MIMAKCMDYGGFAEILMVGGLVVATLCFGVLVSSVYVSADNNDLTDEITIDVPAVCTMRNSIVSGEEHTTSINPLTYQANIGKTTITTTCNDTGGYALYAIGFTGDEYTGTNHTKLVGTNTGATIETGTATGSNTGDPSNWAMKLTAVTGTYAPFVSNGTNNTEDFTNYHAVPDTYTKVATYNSNTDVGTNATGSRLETTYAVYANSTQAADTYIGKVKYTLVHPSTASAPTTPPAPTSTCTTKVPGITYMQELNSSNTATIMANMTDGAQYYLRDSRDEEPYCVSKIAGAIWMTENLRITGVIPAEGSNFTGSDVNISVCDLDSTVGTCTAGNDSTENDNRRSYTIPMTHDSGNRSNGVWYNYAAATAGTITGTYNSTTATQDICPTGWHMPSRDTNSPVGSINSIAGSSYVSTFLPVDGGYYFDGSLWNTVDGYWWSTVAYNNYDRWRLRWDDGISLGDYYNGYRYHGLYIRCVRTNS